MNNFDYDDVCGLAPMDPKFDGALDARCATVIETLQKQAAVLTAHAKGHFWTQAEAIELCAQLEHYAKVHGGHVALTGGTLYKTGPRKDLDVLIYRSLDEPAFNWDGFFSDITIALGIKRGTDYGWCKKARLGDKRIDFFDPHARGEHKSSADDDIVITSILP